MGATGVIRKKAPQYNRVTPKIYGERRIPKTLGYQIFKV